MSDDKIVPIRGSKLKDDRTSEQPPLNDIPGMLRQMADRFDIGELTLTSLILIVPVPGKLPDVYGWGDCEGRNEPLIQLELAKQFMIQTVLDD